MEAIQQALELQELDNVYGIPELGHPADGLTKTASDMAPLLRRLEPWNFAPIIGHCAH